jgi:NADPH-dependent 2,4-dienoyl-CoA reductase/sulfur reductase-like enzyme
VTRVTFDEPDQWYHALARMPKSASVGARGRFRYAVDRPFQCKGIAMASPINIEVLIVGGDPVGLTLAMDLPRRGVAVTVAEMRAAGEPPSVRCNHVSARTMEIFRRLGIVRAVRDAGLPADYPNDQ